MIEDFFILFSSTVGFFELLITAVATYGIASLVTKYDGYKGMFIKLRSKYPDSALNCTVCSAVWLTPITLALLFLGQYYILYALAIIGLVIFIEEAL